MVYAEFYHSETYDARLEQEGWKQAGFTGSWKPVLIESADTSILMPEDGPPVKEREYFKPSAFFTTTGGDRVMDFGQNMKDNFVDIPTDCPQRDERLGWTGDAEVFSRSANYLMETAPSFRKWLRDLAVSQLPDGQVPHVVPDVPSDIADLDAKVKLTGNAGADAAVIVPWMVYVYSGDKAVLEEQYPSIRHGVLRLLGRAAGENRPAFREKRGRGQVRKAPPGFGNTGTASNPTEPCGART